MTMHRLVVPNWHPPLKNECDGRHWSVRARLKKQTAEMIGVYARQQDIPRATGKRRVTLTIILGPRQVGGDPDAYWLMVCDALVTCGLLVDDSRKWVELPPAQFDRAYEAATVIELEDLS